MSTAPRRTRRWFFLFISLLLPPWALQAAAPLEVPPGLQRALEVQQAHLAGLMSRPGVVGVGLGLNPGGHTVLRILTEHAGVAGLPQSLDGLTVETQVTGRFTAQQALTPTDRWPRPVPIGVSVAHVDVTGGTLGARVQRGSSSRRTYYVLSNNHVLANRNLALPGDAILQPGPIDGGVAPADVIARLTDFQTITWSSTASNTMDAAIAEVVNGSVDLVTPLDGYGAPSKFTLSPSLNLPVMKYGRSSRLTNGTITGINYAILVDYGNGQSARFINQMIITGAGGGYFSQAGDSGSLVVASSGYKARRAVGLLFAASGNVSAASPIRPILNRFGVSISGN